MIIITQNTEKKLFKQLDIMADSRHDMRCLYIPLSSVRLGKDILKTLIQALKPIMNNKEATLFHCHNDDLVLFETGLTMRTLETLYNGDTLSNDATILKEVTKLYDCHHDADAIEAVIKDISQKKKEREVKKQFQEKQKILQDIQTILRGANTSDINARRSRRLKPSLLIVEDDRFTQSLIAKTVDPSIEVTFASNAKEALTQYITLAPDMVLLDIGLPDINGHAVMKHILDIDPDAYIVMLSGSASARNIVGAVERGAKGFIGKPFNRQKLSSYTQKSPFIQSKLKGVAI